MNVTAYCQVDHPSTMAGSVICECHDCGRFGCEKETLSSPALILATVMELFMVAITFGNGRWNRREVASCFIHNLATMHLFFAASELAESPRAKHSPRCSSTRT